MRLGNGVGGGGGGGAITNDFEINVLKFRKIIEY